MILALAEAARNIRTAAAGKNQKETMMLELDQIRYELSEAKSNLREVGESL